MSVIKFNAQQLFESLVEQERERINSALLDHSARREQDRYLRLEKAETEKQVLVQELELIEYEIAENNEWFVSAKENKVEVTSESLKQHTSRAEKLYSRKKLIIGNLLPSAESTIQDVVTKIELEEQQENYYQQNYLERLLEPIYEENERIHDRKVIAEFKEKEKRKEEEKARRDREYELLLARLREEEKERKEKIELENRKNRIERISASVHEKKIPYLVHFTPIVNLPSIIENGLLSRNHLPEGGYIFTDEYRTDGWLDWISASISFPNYKMFYSKQNSLQGVDGWAVLIIQPEVLWELDCKYILTNAASSGIRMFTDSRWSSIEAFEDMFGNAEHRNNIPEYYTTDPQAEVMIRKEVPLRYIKVIAVRNKHERDRLSNLNGFSVKVLPQLFSYRNDFEHWRQFRLSAFSDNNSTVTTF